MDEKNIHIKKISEDLSEPEVSVEDAWEKMQLLLKPDLNQEIGKNKASSGSLKPLIKASGIIGITGVVVYMLFLIIKLNYREAKNINEVLYKTEKKVYRVDSLPGVILTFDRLGEYSLKSADTLNYQIKSNKKFHIEASKPVKISIGMLTIECGSGSSLIVSSTNAGIDYEIEQLNSGAKITTKDSSYTIIKGEKLSIIKQITYKGIADFNHAAFATNILEFNDLPLSQVFNQIDQAYGTNIYLQYPETGNCRLTSRFDNKKIEEVLDIICFTLNLSYQKDKNKILIVGKSCN